MKTSFVSICIPLHRIGEETLYVPVIRLLWKSTSNISNSECSWYLGECGNRDNDWQEVEKDCLIFTFGCESTFKTLHLIFFLNLNRNQVHQNQKKPSEGRKKGHQRKKATAERSRPERNSRWGNRAAQEARRLGRCLEGERKNISAVAQCRSCLDSTEENNTGDQLGQVTSQLWGERKKISFYHFFEHGGGANFTGQAPILNEIINFSKGVFCSAYLSYQRSRAS